MDHPKSVEVSHVHAVFSSIDRLSEDAAQLARRVIELESRLLGPKAGNKLDASVGESPEVSGLFGKARDQVNGAVRRVSEALESINEIERSLP